MLKRIRIYLQKLSKENNLINETVFVKAPLEIAEAIGNPDRYDYPLYKGKEFLVEANVRGVYGQAFTRIPHSYEGKISDILDMDHTFEENTAILISTLNAVMRYLGMVANTRHCKDKEPGLCAKDLIPYLRENYPSAKKIGLLGLQPAFLDSLSNAYGSENVICSDLGYETVGSEKSGVCILDGSEDNKKLMEESDLIFATGTIFVNNTADEIVRQAKIKPVVIFGVTAAGAAEMTGLPRYCPYSS
ncbi:MAG: hypothetical protein K8T10_02350 [Candidatus Eremiobacteraeota bacterium]|nr:hypothetical protein [Candidatus Eremiobacteraeota bacterium]